MFDFHIVGWEKLYFVRFQLRSLHPVMFWNLSLTTTYTLMSLDFHKRSVVKILERIIPPFSGGRDELRYANSRACFTCFQYDLLLF